MVDIGSPLFWLKEQNSAIMASGPTATSIGRWIPNDTITICNGSLCEKWVYLANGNFARISLPVPDNGRGYKNGSASLQSGVLGDWDAVFSMLYKYIDYSATQPYISRSGSVTVTVVPSASTDAGFGSSLSMGFDWGGARSSDAFNGSGQGGTVICGAGGCKVMNAY